MHRIASLKGDNLFPAALGDLVADLDCGTEGVRKVGNEVRKVQYLNRTRDSHAPLRVEGSHTRMVRISRAVDLIGHHAHLFIGNRLDRLDVHHGQHRIALDVGIAQCDTLRVTDSIGAFQQAHHRHREEGTVTEGQFLCCAHGISDIHEALQGVEVTGAHHYGIAGGLRTDHNRGQRFCLIAQGVMLFRVVYEQRIQGVGTDRLDHAGASWGHCTDVCGRMPETLVFIRKPRVKLPF